MILIRSYIRKIIILSLFFEEYIFKLILIRILQKVCKKLILVKKFYLSHNIRFQMKECSKVLRPT